MSLRLRWALSSALVAVLAVLIVGGASMALSARGLRGEVDRALLERAEALSRIPPGDLIQRLPQLPNLAGGVSLLRPLIGYDFEVQIVGELGNLAFRFEDAVVLPVDGVDIAVARGESDSVLRTVRVDDTQFRIVTAPLRRGAVQIARDMTPVLGVLGLLGRRLVLVGGFVAFAAALAGWLLAGRAVRPIEELTRAAEDIASTQDLSSPIPTAGPDEVGRLAASFATMIAALSESRRQQQRLVSDAGHELRTPLTGLRTNIEILRRMPDLPTGERAEVVGTAMAEVDELGQLLDELVSLATDARASEEPVIAADLFDIAEPVVGRYSRLLGRPVMITGNGVIVRVRPSQIERALGNLIDNAAKWSPSALPILVEITESTVVVRDHGPGLAEDDLPRVFDRFYRSPAGRAMPGSGLGLAIVKQAVEANGGTVFAGSAEGGGAEVGFTLPAG